MTSKALETTRTASRKDAACVDAPTPMMAQYLDVKSKHPGFLLFYRMGDFFELFFDDAVQAAEALGIQLTKRGKHLGDDIPMCGVPVVRSEEYLHKLIKKGFRVAVAEQLEDPNAARARGAKAVVKRDVVRLVTPGTLTEDALLSAKHHNFLTAVFGSDGRAGRFALASLDLSTGEFFLSEVDACDFGGELFRLAPAEVVVPEGYEIEAVLSSAFGQASPPVSLAPKSCFAAQHGERKLKAAFELAALDGLGEFSERQLAAIGGLFHYLDLTQMGSQPALQIPRRELASDLLAIDAATRASLELVRPKHDGAPTVFSALDRTVTAAGGRELMRRLLSPSADCAAINSRLDSVSFFVADWSLREDVRRALRQAPDINRALSRLKLERGGPRDIGCLRDGLNVASDLAQCLSRAAVLPVEIRGAYEALNALPSALAHKLAAALDEKLPMLPRDGGFIRQGFDESLDRLRELATNSKTVLAKLQAEYAALTGVKTLKIQYNQIFGYFIEVSAGAASALQAESHRALFRQKQTLANAVRFTTDKLSELESGILSATAESVAREVFLFDELIRDIRAAEHAICNAAIALANLDCATALAELATTQNYVRPIVDNSGCFLVEAGRHPCVELALAKSGGAFIGNPCKLDGAGAHAPALLIMTGPNMAGKSTYLRQNALIAVLAQMGSFVPAASARVGVADRLFSRIGTADDLSRGRSTFLVEMTETAAILNQATARSLVILDEIGRGTSTFDGLSIAWAVIEDLHDRIGCRALVATHYHELTRLGDALPRASNVRMAVKEWKDKLVFLHAVEPGAAQRSYGVQAARLAGVPKSVIARAKAVLAQIEAETAGSKIALPDAMPLFAALADDAGEEEPCPLTEKMRELDLDRLSPREALELLYSWKQEFGAVA